VKDIMSKPVLRVDENKSVKTAGEMMAKARRGVLIVTKDDKPIGIITDSDIIKKVIAKNLKPSELKVEKLMSKPLVSIGPEATLLDAARKMKRNNIKRLPVVSEGKLIGLISTTDIARTSPEMLDILEFKLRTTETPTIIKESTTSGICDSCGNYYEELKHTDDQWLCEDCMDELKAEE
jgi:CBS domain-containing protein